MTPFDSRARLIVVRAELVGPRRSVSARLALDTGATTTAINTALLLLIGCDPALSPERVQVTTASG